MRLDNRKQEMRAAAAALQKYAHMILDAAICLYILLILVAMPFYSQEGYAHIGTDKSVFFFQVSVRMAKAAALLLILYLLPTLALSRRKKGNLVRLWALIKENASVTDWFAAAYGICAVLSYLFSRYKSDALWGASGWYMGLCRQLILVGVYFYISKIWKPKKWIFYAILPVSAAVFLLEYLNRFGVYPLDMGTYGSTFISTIGNINWYCGYHVSVFFAGVILLWQGKSYQMWQRLLLAAYVVLGFASLVTQGSSSGIVAMIAVLLIMFCMSVADSDKICRFWQVMTLFGGACLMTWGIQRLVHREINYKDMVVEILLSKEFALLVTAVSFFMLLLAAVDRRKRKRLESFWRTLERICVSLTVILLVGYTAALVVNTLWPGSLGALSDNQIFVFSNEWGSSRGATWKAGALCFWEQDLLHKLVGVGPDAMAAYIYQGGSSQLQELVKEAFSTARLTNAHNEWLTVLVNMGILGFISYAGLMLSGMARLMGRKGDSLISCACGFCLLGYTVNNMFSFQQSMNAATIFVIFGMGEAFCRQRRQFFTY
ncbi:MAG: O-antigen ligase family protein [Blautia sp.]|nr:O-antigen ligase family protein [Blautia sp.]